MIEAKDIVKSFDGNVVLDHVSATLRDGEVNMIIGQSGSGKTVFMKSLTDLGKAFIVTETIINVVIIVCIVSVSGGHKHRTKINGVYIHLFKVGDKVDNLIETVYKIAVIDPRSTAETKRIDMIEYRFVYPIHNNLPFSFYTLIIVQNRIIPCTDIHRL